MKNAIKILLKTKMFFILFLFLNINLNPVFGQEFTYPSTTAGGWEFLIQPEYDFDFSKTGIVLEEGFLSLKATGKVGSYLGVEWGGIKATINHELEIQRNIPDFLIIGFKIDMDSIVKESYIAFNLQNQHGEWLSCGANINFRYPHWQEVHFSVKDLFKELGQWRYKYFTSLRIMTGVRCEGKYIGADVTWSFDVDYIYGLDSNGIKTVYDDFGGPVVSVESSEQIPTEFILEQNYPNPFNPITIINFFLPREGLYTLKVYDILGREVATLISSFLQAGYHSVDFNAENLPSGVYIYRLETEKISLSKKMILVK